MTKEEKIILKKAIKNKEGLLSPATMINGIAKRDQQSVENLVVKGYLEEVPRDKTGLQGNTYTVRFYRVTEKGLARVNLIKWIWFNSGSFWKFVISSMLGAFLALGGNIYFNNYLVKQESVRLAGEIKWEIYENISDIFNNLKCGKQEETFNKLRDLDPNMSVLDTNYYYFSQHSARDQLYKSRSDNLGILKPEVMKEVFNFYSLLYAVNDGESELKNTFVNKVNAKVATIISMTDDISDNTKRMRTVGAQAVGKIMYYYNVYDFDLQKKDSPELSTERIIDDLLAQANNYLDTKQTDEIIGNVELAEYLKLYDNEIYDCFSSFDVCTLATSHYLMLKTGKVQEDVQVYNGLKKK